MGTGLFEGKRRMRCLASLAMRKSIFQLKPSPLLRLQPRHRSLFLKFAFLFSIRKTFTSFTMASQAFKTLAFAFLPEGGFALTHPRLMDRSLSYSLIPAFVPSVRNNARVVVSN